MEQAAVVSEKLNVDSAKDRFEIGRRQNKIAGALHASSRRSKTVKIIGRSGDSLAAASQTAAARNSTEILHD
jgi:hypothetical protein